jgi:two-component system OmpR family response regulator
VNMQEQWPPFRVLYADDNKDLTDSAVLLLGTVGFEAHACYDGATALRVAESLRPSVCFLDLNMPGMNGDEVAQELRLKTWCPRVLVAVTALNDENSRSRTKAATFNLHMVKPVDPRKLVDVVEALFRSAESATVHSTGLA